MRNTNIYNKGKCLNDCSIPIYPQASFSDPCLLLIPLLPLPSHKWLQFPLSPTIKHVPPACSPELLSLVCTDNFRFNFVNTLCPALTQLSGSTQATNYGKSNAIKHMILFLCLFFWASAGSKHPPSGKQHLVRRNRHAIFPVWKRKDDLPSTLYG